MTLSISALSMFALPMFSVQAAAPGAPFYADSSFWVAFCVIAFLAFVIWKGAGKAIGSALDARSNAIKDELEEARRLREEAQALLASYMRKQKEAEAQADAIIKQARHDAEVMAANSRKELAERLERRAAMAEAKIAHAETQALAEVRGRAADLALDAAQELLKTGLSAGDKAKLVKSGISSMGNMLN